MTQEPEMELEEKVARAICKEEGHDPEKFDVLNPDNKPNYPNIPNWTYWRAHARVVIAILETNDVR